MTAALRVHAIIHIAIGIPIQWLTATTNELGEYNWGIVLIGRVVDTLYDVCIQEVNIKIFDASFIGYEIDILFEYNYGEGSTSNVWCQGKVVSIINENKNVAEIIWKEGDISEIDQRTLR